MPYLNSKSNQFRVDIPRNFIPSMIKEKYNPYLHRLPVIFDDISDLVASTIQSVTIPAASYEPVVQQQAKESPLDLDSRGFNRGYRASAHKEELIDKSFTITFKLIDGYLNYWVLQETFWYYYDYSTREHYTFDIPVRIIDSDGLVMFSAIYKEVMFTGMGEFELSYANNIRDFSSFDCSFRFNVFETSIEFD